LPQRYPPPVKPGHHSPRLRSLPRLPHLY
jgi:hypothetical protein